MKKLLLLLLVFAGFIACENEIIEELPQETSVTEGITSKKSQKIDVCHKGKIINVSVNALGGHQGHGDAIDWDADGYFDIENDCSEVDCDDTNADVNPGMDEIVYNGVDDDCNPATLDDDLDEDGYNLEDDCDDTNAAVNPGMDEIVYNGVDDDCNPATLDDDLDEDGYNLEDDCDDTNAAVNPGMEEIVYNGVDDDCDPLTLDEDLDEDGFTIDEGDCDDNNAEVNPDAAEVCGNGFDDNCNGATDEGCVVLEIGDFHEGGIVFYLAGPNEDLNGDGESDQGLVAARYDQGEFKWWNGSNVITGATGIGIGTGQANTTAIVAIQGEGSYAAQVCDDLELDGYDDWFLPSKDELNMMYVNLHDKDRGNFENGFYWSSTESNISQAWDQRFYNGNQFTFYKNGYDDEEEDFFDDYVRAVRVF